jgi:hypothetical protein
MASIEHPLIPATTFDRMDFSTTASPGFLSTRHDRPVRKIPINETLPLPTGK